MSCKFLSKVERIMRNWDQLRNYWKQKQQKTVMESAYFKKYYGVCPPPPFLNSISEKFLAQMMLCFHYFITFYSILRFHRNPNQYKGFQDLPAGKWKWTQGFGPSIIWGPGQALHSAHLCTADGLPCKGNKSTREGAATHPRCALICPRLAATRVHTSPKALRCIARFPDLEIVSENLHFKLIDLLKINCSRVSALLCSNTHWAFIREAKYRSILNYLFLNVWQICNNLNV